MLRNNDLFVCMSPLRNRNKNKICLLTYRVAVMKVVMSLWNSCGVRNGDDHCCVPQWADIDFSCFWSVSDLMTKKHDQNSSRIINVRQFEQYIWHVDSPLKCIWLACETDDIATCSEEEQKCRLILLTPWWSAVYREWQAGYCGL